LKKIKVKKAQLVNFYKIFASSGSNQVKWNEFLTGLKKR